MFGVASREVVVHAIVKLIDFFLGVVEPDRAQSSVEQVFFAVKHSEAKHGNSVKVRVLLKLFFHCRGLIFNSFGIRIGRRPIKQRTLYIHKFI